MKHFDVAADPDVVITEQQNAEILEVLKSADEVISRPGEVVFWCISVPQLVALRSASTIERIGRGIPDGDVAIIRPDVSVNQALANLSEVFEKAHSPLRLDDCSYWSARYEASAEDERAAGIIEAAKKLPGFSVKVY